MDFDHIPGRGKSFGLGGNGGVGHTMIELQDEVAKCELVCSNCHRVRTARRHKKGR